MAAANPLNATFFAMQKREKSGVLLGASVAYGIIALVLGGVFLALNYATVGPLLTWYVNLVSQAAQGQRITPEDIGTLPAGLGMFALSGLVFAILFYVARSAYEAACLRWMIRGETGGFMGLTLGADTWRVFLTYIIWALLGIAFGIVVGIITAALVGMATVASNGAGADPTRGLLTLLRLIVQCYFAVRLAPAAATSVGQGKFSFFDAWKVTRGRFWALFGAFFVVVLILAVIEMVIGGAVFAVVGGQILPQIFAMGAHPDQGEVLRLVLSLFTPQNFVVLGVAYLLLVPVTLFGYVLFYGINARAVLAAAEDGKIDVAGAGAAKTFE